MSKSIEGAKIMDGGNLDNIVLRLNCCAALLRALHASTGESGVPDELRNALAGSCDLLEMIIRDFQANISAAGDFWMEEV